MWNDWLKTLKDLLCLPNDDLLRLGPICAQSLYKAWNMLKQVKLDLLMAFAFVKDII